MQSIGFTLELTLQQLINLHAQLNFSKGVIQALLFRDNQPPDVYENTWVEFEALIETVNKLLAQKETPLTES